ncbi:MAG: hypothetical protein MI923_05715 [Phycisphaerales bacterium]|nr:hypothetical protein [Phycisphaerales bacterium]
MVHRLSRFGWTPTARTGFQGQAGDRATGGKARARSGTRRDRSRAL